MRTAPLIRGCALLVAGALAASGCGGKAKSGQTATHAAPAPPASTTTATTATTAAPVKDCNALGINPAHMREGTCTHGGLTYVIVDRTHFLHLRTLSADLQSVHAVSALSGSAPTPAQGKFVIASLDFTNKLPGQQTVDKNGAQQTALILDGHVYKEDVAAEKTSDPRSCVAQQGRFTRGSSVSCEAVFQVPAASAADLEQHGRADLYVVDFGYSLAGSAASQTVGVIRLYR